MYYDSMIYVLLSDQASFPRISVACCMKYIKEIYSWHNVLRFLCHEIFKFEFKIPSCCLFHRRKKITSKPFRIRKFREGNETERCNFFRFSQSFVKNQRILLVILSI